MLAALWGFSLWAIGRLPGRVPIHWNLAGEVDGWGTPLTAALMLPAIGTVVYLVILAYDWGGLDFKAARAMSAATTRQIRILVLLLMGGLHGSILWAAMHAGATPASRLMLIMALFYILLGNLLPRLEPNAWAGIRIPPTLEDREVWKRTHRMCGKWMVVAGAAGVPSSFLPERITTGLTLLLLCAPLLAAVGYAYWLRHRMDHPGTHPSEVP
jgi:uncharacterized membrane protein